MALVAPSWFRRLWRSRLTPILVLAFLYAGALTLEPRGSLSGSLARLPLLCIGERPLSRAGWTYRRFERIFVWAESGGEISVVRDGDPDGQARLDALPPNLHARRAVAIVRAWRPGGALWASVWDTRVYRMAIFATRQPLSPQESAAYRAAVYDFISADPAWGDSPPPPTFRTADSRITHLRWSGVVANAYALACAAILGAWVLARLRTRARAFRARQRLQRGQCTHCGYDASISALQVCPECGHPPR